MVFKEVHIYYDSQYRKFFKDFVLKFSIFFLSCLIRLSLAFFVVFWILKISEELSLSQLDTSCFLWEKLFSANWSHIYIHRKLFSFLMSSKAVCVNIL